jgi:homoserine kinase
MKKIRVSAPATIANVGPCFDVLGVALENPRDIIEVELREESNDITIQNIEGINGNLISRDINKNTAGLAAKALLNNLKIKLGLKIKIIKGIRPASGMGSSGASASGVVYAISKLLERKIDNNILIGSAAEGERAAANEPHADNVAASLIGGFVIIKAHHPLEYNRFVAPKNLRFAIVLPEFSLETSKSRAVLPIKLSFKDSIIQMGNCAYLISALMEGNLIKIGKAVNSDSIIEPLRAPLIKGFNNIKNSALRNGAYGCSISGGGPSIFAICDSENQMDVLSAMENELKELDIKFTSYPTKPSNEGTKIVK